MGRNWEGGKKEDAKKDSNMSSYWMLSQLYGKLSHAYCMLMRTRKLTLFLISQQLIFLILILFYIILYYLYAQRHMQKNQKNFKH